MAHPSSGVVFPPFINDLIEQFAGLFPPHIEPHMRKVEILLALSVVAVTLLLVFASKILHVLSSSSGGSNKVAIVGPCNGGKTCLFYQLLGEGIPDGTVASMQENDGTCRIKTDKGRAAGSVRVVDVPGHERLRHKLDMHLKDARAVIFVLDSVDITPHKVDAAEELFEVLTNPSIAKRRVPILLACNKMDLETQAHSVDFIRRTLEKQLEAMRKTRTSLSPEAAAKAAVLGKSDKPLSLAALRNPVSVAAISALKADIADVHAFLSSAMR